MAVDPVKYNQLASVGTLEAGDTVLGEKVSGTTGRLTVGTLSITDGDKGDITVSSSGDIWRIDTPSSVTVATNDKVLIKDTSDSDALKYVTAQSVADLAAYSNEQAQDAVGGMVDTTLVYTDSTPLLSRAALTGDVTASAGSNATTLTTPSSATVATDDKVLIKDTSNSDAYRYVTAQSIGNLGAVRFISSQTASASATLDFTAIGNYSKVIFILNDIIPATDNTRLEILTSADNTNWDTGVSDYEWIFGGLNSAAVDVQTGDNADDSINLATGVGNAAGEALSGELTLYNPSGTGHTNFTGNFSVINAAGALVFQHLAARRVSAAAVTGVRFRFVTGNITSGSIYMYGVSKT